MRDKQTYFFLFAGTASSTTKTPPNLIDESWADAFQRVASALERRFFMLQVQVGIGRALQRIGQRRWWYTGWQNLNDISFNPAISSTPSWLHLTSSFFCYTCVKNPEIAHFNRANLKINAKKFHIRANILNLFERAKKLIFIDVSQSLFVGNFSSLLPRHQR